MPENFFPPIGGSGGLIRDRDRQWLDSEISRRVMPLLLAEATADGTSTTLEVTNIPQTHRDLLLMVHGSNDGSSLRAVSVTINGDTGSNYRWVRIQSDDNGSPASSSQQSGTSFVVGAFGDDGFLSSLRMELFGYSKANNQSVTWQGYGSQGTLAGNSRTFSGSGAHVEAAAITSIELTMAVDNWQSGSTLRIYGF